MNDMINQNELTRRALQEAIESAKQAIKQTRDLIEGARAIGKQADLIPFGTVASGAPIKRPSYKSGTI